MLFEKTIRKKRPSPFYLELLANLILYWIPMTIFSLIICVVIHVIFLKIPDYTNSNWPILIPVFLIFALYLPIDLLVCNRTAVKQGLSTRKKVIEVLRKNDVILVDYWTIVLIPGIGMADYSDLYLFFAEPYIYKIAFLTLPKDHNIVLVKEFKFYSPPSWKFRFNKDYRRYKEEFLASGFEDMKGRPSYTSGNLRDAKKYGGKDYQVYYMYITYEKAQVFNRLFELVKPPKFRIVFNAKGNILLELQPIPGKEYPPEALECMEKINSMYP